MWLILFPAFPSHMPFKPAVKSASLSCLIRLMIWKQPKLAQNIAHKIEEELKYPGEIKVNVIREMRVTEYARKSKS